MFSAGIWHVPCTPVVGNWACSLSCVLIHVPLPLPWCQEVSLVLPHNQSGFHVFPFCTHVPIFSAHTWFRNLITNSIPRLVRAARWTWGLQKGGSRTGAHMDIFHSHTSPGHAELLYHSGCWLPELIWQAGRWRLGKCPSFRTLLSGVKLLRFTDHGHLSGDWSGDKYTSYVNWKMNGMNGWGGKALRNPGPVLIREVEMVTAHWQDWSSGKIPGVGGAGSPAFSWWPAGICVQSRRNGKTCFCGPQSHIARLGVVGLEKLQHLEHGLPHIHGFKCRYFHCPISLCHWRETTVEEPSALGPTDGKFVLGPHLTVEVICMWVDLQSEGCMGYIAPTQIQNPQQAEAAFTAVLPNSTQSLWLQHFRNMGEPKSWKCARENETPIKNVGDLSKNLEWM